MGMMAYAYNLSTSEAEARGAGDMDNLSYIVRSRPSGVIKIPPQTMGSGGVEKLIHTHPIVQKI